MDINLELTPFLFSKVLSISKKSKKKFFLTPLEKSKNFKIFKIFNNIGRHDGLKKKIPNSAKTPLIPVFFIHPVCIYYICICVYMYLYQYIYIYIYRRANGIYIQKSCRIWTVCPCCLNVGLKIANGSFSNLII